MARSWREGRGWQLREQVIQAQMQPWDMPFGLDYSWFVAFFMNALEQMKGSGWLHKAHRLQLVLLQELDGHFELTQDLANLLWIGTPCEPLETHPYPCFNLETLRATIPQNLHEAVFGATRTLNAEAIWATMCALELYDLQPLMSEWVTNPKAPPHERRTLREHAQMWLIHYVTPHMPEGRMEEWQASAAALIETSFEDRLRLLHKLKASGVDERLDASIAQHKSVRLIARDKMISFFWLVVAAHPLLALWSTPHSAQLTRAERIILQVNNIFMMLSVVLWFTYSRAMSCCQIQKGHLGCPSAGDAFAPCIGFKTCGDLNDYGVDLGWLPEELPHFVPETDCDAFPRPTWLGRLQAVICIVLVLLPANAVLQAMFVMSNSTPVPSHWHPLPSKHSKSSKRLLGPVGSVVVHSVSTVLYALFVDLSYFNKAMALIIVGTFTAVFNLQKKALPVLRAIRSAVQKLQKLAMLPILAVFSIAGSRALVERQTKKLERLEYLAQLNVMPSIDGTAETFTYLFLFSFWGMLLWTLLAFQAFLRSVLGREGTDQILLSWVINLAMEHFGLASLRLIAFKLVSTWIGAKLSNAFANDEGIGVWYEQHVSKVFSRFESLIDANKTPEDEEEDEDRDASVMEGEGEWR
ncbi:hypothetical protein CYMTET_46419 [Cymbomonas tetramitiformis]|uniref:Uncharacterized protein n=1 Tax=Cymbomonas tetramitiformis TaxID=36881 RepID=A0AAE0EXA9_9CHLO|nr:hypothetical protein CYMTET_46419 [Cymbomonas tetramitiformis]